MTHKRIESLLKKRVLPELPGWQCKGKLLFKAPIGFNYIGFEIQPSQWDKDLISNVYFQFTATAMEDERYLEVARIHVRRPTVEFKEWWLREGDDVGFAADLLQAIRTTAPPVEAILRSPRTLIDRYHELEAMYHPFNEEFRAVNLVLVGDLDAASILYDRRIQRVEADNERGTFQLRLERLRLIRSAIDKGLEAAIWQLREFEEAFAKEHRLEPWIDRAKWQHVPA